jgi:hypothetical protein
VKINNELNDLQKPLIHATPTYTSRPTATNAAAVTTSAAAAATVDAAATVLLLKLYISTVAAV